MIAATQSVLSSQPASVGMFTRHCIAYGVPFHLRSTDAGGLAAMLDTLPFGTSVTEADSPSTTCFSLPPTAHPRFPALLARFEQQVLLHVAVSAPHRTFLHAGVVAWHGRAVILPGASHAGKSTLVAELVKLGAVYYSDEYAVLDSSGMVHPYPRDLRMRAPGSPHQTTVPMRSPSGKVADTSAVVAHVIFTSFVPGAEWNPRPLTQGLAVLDMLPHCIPARRHPLPVLGTLKALMRRAHACHTARGDAKTTAKLLLQTLGSADSQA